MPTYDYRCAKCGEELEVFQTFAEAPLTKHKGCGGKLAKVLSPAGIVLKGSGFYKTDNRSSKSMRSAAEGLERQERIERPSTESSDIEGRRARDSSGSGSSSSGDNEVGLRLRIELVLRQEAGGEERLSPREPLRPRSASSAGRASTASSTRSTRSRSTRRSARRATRSRSATVGDRRVAFIPRHGRDHRHTPAAVPARANLWALRDARRAHGHRAVRGRVAAARRAPRRLRRARPARRPHVGPARHVLRRGPPPPRVVRRSVLPGRRRGTRSRRATRVGVPVHDARHRRGRAGPALLDARRVGAGTARRAGTSST